MLFRRRSMDNVDAHTNQYTPTPNHTRDETTITLNKPTLSANVGCNFLTGTCTHLAVKITETLSLRSNVWLLITRKGGNEERDIRLQVVKLLTALSYFVRSFLLFFCVPALV